MGRDQVDVVADQQHLLVVLMALMVVFVVDL